MLPWTPDANDTDDKEFGEEKSGLPSKDKEQRDAGEVSSQVSTALRSLPNAEPPLYVIFHQPDHFSSV